MATRAGKPAGFEPVREVSVRRVSVGSTRGSRGVLEGSTRSPRGLRGVYEESTRGFRRVYTGSTRNLREIYEGSARARISRISPHETRDFLTSSILDLILLTSF